MYYLTKEDHDFQKGINRKVENSLGPVVSGTRRRRGSPGGKGGVGGSTKVRWATVVSVAPAEEGSTGCGHVVGSMVVREWQLPRDWDTGDYEAGEVIKLPDADAFDEELDYDEEELVVKDGILYQAKEDIEADEWDAGQWQLIGTPGDHYCPTDDVEAGPWDPDDWNLTDAEYTDATTRTEPPDWDPEGIYEIGDGVKLPDADAFSESLGYVTGALVIHADLLYQAPDDVEAGSFDAGDWILLGAVGDTFRAVVDTSGLWSVAAWNEAPIPGTGEPLLTTLDYYLPISPEVGSTIGFIGTTVIEIEQEGAGGSAGCGRIEISTIGGFSLRFISDTCTSEWSIAASTFCNDIAINPPAAEPS